MVLLAYSYIKLDLKIQVINTSRSSGSDNQGPTECTLKACTDKFCLWTVNTFILRDRVKAGRGQGRGPGFLG